jgi:hypothetical protein
MRRDEEDRIPPIGKRELEAMIGIPPDEWLMVRDRTAHEFIYWMYLRQLYTSIKLQFEDLFSGGSNSAELPLCEFCPEIPREAVQLYYDYYLALYLLIHASFAEIKAGMDWKIPPSGAGELLWWLMALDAAAMLSECVAGARYAPRREFDYLRLKQKEATITKPNELSKLQKLEAQQQRPNHLALKGEVIKICAKLSKPKLNNRIRQKLGAYKQADAALNQLWAANNHPRKGRKGWQWINGTCFEIS